MITNGNAQADVLVVGSGNAAFSAALSAAEQGADVLMLEKAPAAWAGGNSYFTAGAYRLTHEGVDDLRDLVGHIDGEVEVLPYSAADYEADMVRVTQGRCEPTLTRFLATHSRDAAEWMHSHGVGWRLMFDRQSHMVDGKVRFWGNLVTGTVGGGQGLIEAYTAAALRSGVRIRYDTPASAFLVTDGVVSGVQTPSGPVIAGAVIMASGGFEADARLRATYLGSNWDIARVRGTPFNTGELLMRALELGAQPFGHWSACHAIAWDAAAPASGDRSISNRYSRQAYPYALVVNRDGKRFIDEGADFRNYTYAKYGAEILKQPGSIAFQVFDASTIAMTQEIDYSSATTSRYEATSLEEVATRAGIDPIALQRTVEEFNASINDRRFDPTVRDGKSATGIEPPKSNWAQPLVRPPFVAFAVTCGVTFTFGGVRIDVGAHVLDAGGEPIPGLFASGEVVGGLFYHNYPGGTGLASGTVFGRQAGRHAAAFAQRRSTAPRAAPDGTLARTESTTD